MKYPPFHTKQSLTLYYLYYLKPNCQAKMQLTFCPRLPTIFICQKDFPATYQRYQNEGYGNGHVGFLNGNVEGLDGIVSWEGNSSLPYQNITQEIFDSLTKTYFRVNGQPAQNWNFERDGGVGQFTGMKEVFTALDGYCIQLDINATDINEKSDFFNAEITALPNLHIYLGKTNNWPRLKSKIINDVLLHII